MDNFSIVTSLRTTKSFSVANLNEFGYIPFRPQGLRHVLKRHTMDLVPNVTLTESIGNVFRVCSMDFANLKETNKVRPRNREGSGQWGQFLVFGR